MRKTEFQNLLEQVIPQLNSGAFLVSGNSANPMTIGWATFGVIWGKPICTVFVRHSRYSHELMEAISTFTVCVPRRNTQKENLSICGRISGRNTDKLQETGMTVISIEHGCKLLSECNYHFVCKTVAKTEMDMKSVDQDILDRYYNTNQATPDGDPHTVYFAEILEAYENDPIK